MASNRLRLIVTTALATAVLLAVGGAVAGYVVLEAGWYSVAATRQHFQPVHTLLEKGMHESVRFHARDVATPPAGSEAAQREQLRRGAGLYRRHCEQCHGGPGVAQHDIGRSMQPLPGPLVDAARRWKPRELYWVTRHGIKMSGMPAWEYRLADEDLWAIVAFLGRLPLHTAASYREATAGADALEPAPFAPPPAGLPDPRRGRIALSQYACSACHQIPGVTGPETYVGPPLQGLGRRKYVAGVLPNTPDNLVRWIRTPQAVDPHTTMPALGVTERDARDMAAYLLATD